MTTALIQLRKRDTAICLRIALLITAAIAFLVIGGMFLQMAFARYMSKHKVQVADVTLTNVENKAPPPPVPPPPPPPKVEPPKIEIKSFCRLPKIVDQPDQKKEVKQQDELDNTTIGHIDQAGIKGPRCGQSASKVDQGVKL